MQFLEIFQACLPSCWPPNNTLSWLSSNLLASLWVQMRVDNSVQLGTLEKGPSLTRNFRRKGMKNDDRTWPEPLLGVELRSVRLEQQEDCTGSQGSWD